MATNWITPQNVPWQTKLNPAEEDAFRHWVQANNIPHNPDDPVADYDMRGFWKAQVSGDPLAVRSAANNHFPDKWKTPFHEWQSNESQYATPDAPHWEGNILVPYGKTAKEGYGKIQKE
jgi:hypothetical protein